MQLWKKMDSLTVSKLFKLGKGVSSVVTDENGVENNLNPFVKTKIAAFTVPITENGMTYVLSLAGGFATTLPSPRSGLKYRFVVGISNTGAHTIVASGAIVFGSVSSADLNAASDAALSATGITTVTLAANKSVKGDWIELVSDGTAWFLSGNCTVFDAVTFS